MASKDSRTGGGGGGKVQECHTQIGRGNRVDEAINVAPNHCKIRPLHPRGGSHRDQVKHGRVRLVEIVSRVRKGHQGHHNRSPLTRLRVRWNRDHSAQSKEGRQHAPEPASDRPRRGSPEYSILS